MSRAGTTNIVLFESNGRAISVSTRSRRVRNAFHRQSSRLATNPACVRTLCVYDTRAYVIIASAYHKAINFSRKRVDPRSETSRKQWAIIVIIIFIFFYDPVAAFMVCAQRTQHTVSRAWFRTARVIDSAALNRGVLGRPRSSWNMYERKHRRRRRSFSLNL